MKRLLLLLLPFAALTNARAAVVTTFDEASLPATIFLDMPNPALSVAVFDDVNDELDINATANTDLWTARANAAIAWTAIPAGLSTGSTWTVETEVRLNSVDENQQVAGITFYGGPDGAKPDISFGLDNWDPAARAVRMQGLGDNVPNVGIITTASKVILRVIILEGGANDTYNFFFKVNQADPWIQLGGVATNYQTTFPNSRVGLTYKTGAAKSGAAFTYFSVVDTSTAPPFFITQPSPVAGFLGGPAQFTVSAAGATSYQWRRNTVPITTGGNAASYTLTPVTAGDDGASFDCVVTNANGSATSNPALLSVIDPIVGGTHYSSAVQAEPSLLAYFPVDGSTAPAVANVKKPQYGGTLGGTAAIDATVGRTAGTKSISSTGAGWVSLTKDPELDFVDGSGTVEMFAYQAAAVAYNPAVFSVRNGGNGTRFSFHADAAGTKFYFYNGAAAPTWDLPTSGIGRLMHIAFVFRDGQCILYHNGVSLGTLALTLGSSMGLPAEIGASAQSATESFPGNLDEVALYADPLPAAAVSAHYNAWINRTTGSAPVVATQPLSHTASQDGPTSFTVVLNDATGAVYRWQKNGVDIPGATLATYTLSNVTAADQSAQFRCVIYNPFGGVLSNTAVLTVVDTNPPQLLSASAPLSASRVIVTFNEPVDLTGAVFTIAGGTVTGAVAGPLPGMVTLTVTGLTQGQNYSVTVTNVHDLTGNNLATANTGFTAQPTPAPAPIDLVRPASEPAGPATRRGAFVFSEINYHPRDRADLKNLEFIEIYNSQPWPEDLSGFRITGEVAYTFPAGSSIPAGGYRVVAAVPADVTSAYGLTGVLGPWTGALSNAGGQLRLRDFSDGVVFTVDYDAGAPWPVAADGSGHSMVLARPSYGMEDPRAWDSSVNLDGSPGSAEPSLTDPYRAVVINELRANAAPADEFIELYNYSATAVDVSGCSLSDDRDVAKFVFPAGTSIAPGLFLSWYQPQLGFGLKAGGDTLYLRAPGSGGAPGRVLDAVRFGPQRAGTSYGRYPDGAQMFSVLSGGGAGVQNLAPAAKDAVISEIFYSPPAGSTHPPFIEITNTSGAVLDLSGWHLRGGVSYDVPAGTSLAAGARLAVPNFLGTLNKGTGERLRLEKPVFNQNGAVAELIYPVIDEVTYGTGGRWGRWSDGGGSSLELKDLHADGRFAGNWADSDETPETGWVTVENTGVLDNSSGAAINRLHIMMLGEGECLVDDVEVIPNGGSNLITNGGFENGVTGWTINGTHEGSTLEAGGFTGANSLHVRTSGRGDLAGNRITVALNLTPASGSTAAIRAKVKWLRGHPEILLRLNGGSLEAVGNIVPNTVNPGTPGAVNSRAQVNAGPSISGVTHRPVLPQAGQAVTVYARLDDADSIGLALLNYRLDPQTALSSVVMNYRGAGLFSADIPAQPSGTLAAFTISAVDSTGALSSFPDNAPAGECLVRWGEPASAGSLGAYRFWMTEATRSKWITRLKNSNTPLDVTFVYGNSRIIYNAGAQYSGSPFHTPGFNGPTGTSCDYDLNMPGDDRLLGETGLILCGPGTFGDDLSFIREQTIWWIARKIGLPSIHRRFCRVYVNGVQRQTVFEDTQQPNGSWIDEYWPGDNDGHLHKAQDWIEYADDGGTFQTDLRAFLAKRTTTGGTHKVAAYRYQWSTRSVEGSANDWTDFTTLINAANTGTSATDPAYFAAMDPLVDEDSWARALAVQRIAGNWDTWGYTYGKNMYVYKPQHGPWSMTCWDIDFSFGLVGDGATTSLFLSAASQDPLSDKFRNQPAFRRAYWSAFRDSVDGPMLNTNVNTRIDAMVTGLASSGITANAGQVSTVKSYIDARRTYILSQLNGVYSATTFAITGSNTLTDADGIITLTGTAPPTVKTFRINGVTYTPSWTSQTAWNLPLTLFAANNVLTVEGVDLRGNVVSSFPVTITVTGPPPLPPVTINEWQADNTSTYADPMDGQYEDWFELHNSGATAVNLGGFFLTDTSANKTLFAIPSGTLIPAGGYLVVWADDEAVQNATANGQLHAGFRLSSGGESIGLYTPDGIQVDFVTFGNQDPDSAEGRYPDSNAAIVPLAPTPGKRNALPPAVVSLTGTGAMTLTFSTEPTHNYQVESSDNLTTWTPNGPAVNAIGSTLSVNLPASPARRAFWRARLVPMP